MERAKWNGREYTASEIADDFEMEHAIRQVSGRELFCPDPQCETPLLRYCHGEKKHAYFAHLQTGSCDYAQFDKQPGIIREVRYKLYDLFKSKGYDAQIEQKILPHHYTHILLKTGTKTIAIEIGSTATRVGQIDTLQKDYSKIGMIRAGKRLLSRLHAFFGKFYLQGRSLPNRWKVAPVMVAGECERPIRRIYYGRKKVRYFFELSAKNRKKY